jgi:hypothetical protein
LAKLASEGFAADHSLMHKLANAILYRTSSKPPSHLNSEQIRNSIPLSRAAGPSAIL